jgi:hypothetical protein
MEEPVELSDVALQDPERRKERDFGGLSEVMWMFDKSEQNLTVVSMNAPNIGRSSK